MASSEYEDLDQLVHSAGWARFCAMVAKEWGSRESGGGVRFTAAVTESIKSEAEASVIQHLRQITAAQREIHALMHWPTLRLQQTTGLEMERAVGAGTSRRGTL